MLHFSFFCSLAWNHCPFEPWVNVSEKPFKTPLLLNSKTICSFMKDCLIVQIRKRSFLIWGQGNTDSISFPSWDLAWKTYIPQATAPIPSLQVFSPWSSWLSVQSQRSYSFLFLALGSQTWLVLITGLNNLKNLKYTGLNTHIQWWRRKIFLLHVYIEKSRASAFHQDCQDRRLSMQFFL